MFLDVRLCFITKLKPWSSFHYKQELCLHHIQLDSLK